MKKTLVAAILGMVAVSAVNAQSYIKLDTYNAVPNYQAVTYQGNPIADGGYTFGFYVAAGNVVSAVNASFTGGNDIPTGNGLVLAVGANSTTPSVSGGFANISTGSFTYNSLATANATVTIVVLAYNGADYASSAIRGHSQAFTYTATYVGNGPAPAMDGFGAFAVSAVPEPSTFALAGLGLAGLLIFRRRK